jgi:hypothetical protein
MTILVHLLYGLLQMPDLRLQRLDNVLGVHRVVAGDASALLRNSGLQIAQPLIGVLDFALHLLGESLEAFQPLDFLLQDVVTVAHGRLHALPRLFQGVRPVFGFDVDLTDRLKVFLETKKLRLVRAGSFHVKQAKIKQKCHPGSRISKLIFFVDSTSNSKN